MATYDTWFFAHNTSQSVDDVGGHVVIEESRDFVFVVVTLAAECWVPQHFFGRARPPRYISVFVEAPPSQRVVITRRTIVHSHILRSKSNQSNQWNLRNQMPIRLQAYFCYLLVAVCQAAAIIKLIG